jgi:hypothetical protein
VGSVVVRFKDFGSDGPVGIWIKIILIRSRSKSAIGINDFLTRYNNNPSIVLLRP